MPKKSIFSPSARIKVYTLSKAPPPVRPHHHKPSKNFTYGLVLGPLQFQSTDQNTHLISKTVILPVLAFKKNLTHLHSNQPKLSPVPETSTQPLQTVQGRSHQFGQSSFNRTTFFLTCSLLSIASVDPHARPPTTQVIC